MVAYCCINVIHTIYTRHSNRLNPQRVKRSGCQLPARKALPPLRIEALTTFLHAADIECRIVISNATHADHVGQPSHDAVGDQIQFQVACTMFHGDSVGKVPSRTQEARAAYLL